MILALWGYSRLTALIGGRAPQVTLVKDEAANAVGRGLRNRSGPDFRKRALCNSPFEITELLIEGRNYVRSILPLSKEMRV